MQYTYMLGVCVRYGERKSGGTGVEQGRTYMLVTIQFF